MTIPASPEATPRKGCGRPAFWILGAILVGLPLSCAVLLPVFEGAKLSAPSTHCKSYLKQLGTALLMYMEDYDNRFPPAAYVEGTHSVTQPALLYPYVKNYDVWECPTDRKNGIKNHTYDGTPNDTTVSYGYNGFGLAPGGRGLLESQVKQPENTVTFVDSTSHLVVPSPLVPALGGTPPEYRHHSGDNPSINVGWVDGHVKTYVRGMLEEVSTRESERSLGPGIDSFRYWNRW